MKRPYPESLRRPKNEPEPKKMRFDYSEESQNEAAPRIDREDSPLQNEPAPEAIYESTEMNTSIAFNDEQGPPTNMDFKIDDRCSIEQGCVLSVSVSLKVTPRVPEAVE